jgi:hypothetical protein
LYDDNENESDQKASSQSNKNHSLKKQQSIKLKSGTDNVQLIDGNYEIVSANEIIQKSIEKYKHDKNSNEISTVANLNSVENYDDIELNNDPSPIVIKKKNDENIVYKQNVFIRWLQPPTPPPPAPIISKNNLNNYL